MKGTGSPDKILLIGFNNDTLKYLTGKTLSEIANNRYAEIGKKVTVADLKAQGFGAVYVSIGAGKEMLPNMTIIIQRLLILQIT